MTPEQQRRLQLAMQRALEQARAGLIALDRDTLDRLQALFEAAAVELSLAIRNIAGPNESLGPADLGRVQSAVNAVLAGLYNEQVAEIQQALSAAVKNGSNVIGDLQREGRRPGFPVDALQALPDAAAVQSEVLQVVVDAIAEDGLDLSTRLWRTQLRLRDELLPALQRAILQADSARDATRDALARGLKVSPEMLDKIEMARAGALGNEAAAILASPEAKAYGDAARVFRTEIDRANILATRAGIYAVEGIAGTRFLLSPRHPRFDICDMHAKVNLYGLGPGVYPPGQSPLPAHPNTLSYEEAVFEWEVEEKDRAPQDLMTWLASLNDDQLYGILQSENKVAALRAGLLQPEEITKPWRELKPKYEALLQAA